MRTKEEKRKLLSETTAVAAAMEEAIPAGTSYYVIILALEAMLIDYCSDVDLTDDELEAVFDKIRDDVRNGTLAMRSRAKQKKADA